MCPIWGEEYDTSLHLLGRRNALVGKRRKQFGKPLLVPSELRQEHWSSLLIVCFVLFAWCLTTLSAYIGYIII